MVLGLDYLYKLSAVLLSYISATLSDGAVGGALSAAASPAPRPDQMWVGCL